MTIFMRFLLCASLAVTVTTSALSLRAQPGNSAAPWPMFGGSGARNMVNLADKDIPSNWSIEEGKKKNIRWVAELGSHIYGGPVVADGRIFVGTNDASRKNPEHEPTKAVLACLAEKDGKLLWQNTHDSPPGKVSNDSRSLGLCSTPTVAGTDVYYVTPSAIAICADSATGKIRWELDMSKELKVAPFHLANCSPLIVGDLVLLVTGNGVGAESGKVTSPKSPSFVALKKSDGHVVWQSDLPGENVIDGQWSNPALAVIGGKQQVLFAGGDAFLYSFEPTSGKLLWQCDANPRPALKPGERKNFNYFISTPVVVSERVYVGLGQYPDRPNVTKSSYFLCLDAGKSGNVSLKSFDVKDPQNKGSALIWSYGGLPDVKPKKGRAVTFGRTMSTAAVYDGLVYIAEESGYLHCLDAKTGAPYWVHDFQTDVWGSAYVADGRVYVGSNNGEVCVFEHGKTEKIISKIDMDEVIQSTPVVANGVLYITTSTKLYAVAKE